MKKIIKTSALILSIALSFSSVPSFAYGIENTSANIDINENINPQAFYNSFTGVVKESADNTDGVKYLIENEEGIQANFIISENTYFVDDVKITVGSQITGFYEAGKPMIMIYPAQYSIEIVAPVTEGHNIKADKFDEDLLSADKTLKLNISENTEILWENGTTINWFKEPTLSEIAAVLSNRKLIVLYDFTTKSIPAQTTPNKIIVLSEQEIISNDIIVNDIVIEAPSVYINDEEVVMVPIRAISEALGYEVIWNNEQQCIMVGKDISLKIGDYKYNISEGNSVELKTSPILKDGYTYVPLNFFKDIVNINVVSFFENNVIIHDGRPMN